MNGEIVDKKNPGFEEIVHDVKRRQISSALSKILMSDKVILLMGKRLPKPFKVNCIKDVRNGAKKDKKIYIDCSDIFTVDKNTGNIKCRDIDILIAYLASAMVNYIYYINDSIIINSHSIMEQGAICFAKLFTHVVDYLCKISTISGARNKCMYMASMYFMCNIAGKDPNSESVKGLACKIAEISNREADIIELQINEDAFVNIKFFCENLANVMKISKISFDVIVEKWMYLYGEGTVFALEHFPSFTTMILDAYVGCYINNQKTIEKITGKNMVMFAKEILDIGSEVV